MIRYNRHIGAKNLPRRFRVTLIKIIAHRLKEIREVEGKVRVEIRDVEVEVKLTQAIHRQTLWMIGSVGAVIGLIRLLEWFLVHLPKP
ncbi:MAG: hypothetical protein PHE55_09780 [Methylococcaceae bacterium]|nr:hypothetical protein [Methylococcaceae bacterium]